MRAYFIYNVVSFRVNCLKVHVSLGRHNDMREVLIILRNGYSRISIDTKGIKTADIVR